MKTKTPDQKEINKMCLELDINEPEDVKIATKLIETFPDIYRIRNAIDKVVHSHKELEEIVKEVRSKILIV